MDRYRTAFDVMASAKPARPLDSHTPRFSFSPGRMIQLSRGTWVQFADHPDVPRAWRGTWGLVKFVSGELPKVTISNATGQTVAVLAEHVKSAP